MSSSQWEERFLDILRNEGHRTGIHIRIPEREWYFALPERKWRFDFAWPHLMVAVEIEGGIWIGGRHSVAAGIEADCEKYNWATARGWKILRFTPNYLGPKQEDKVYELVLLALGALDVD